MNTTNRGRTAVPVVLIAVLVLAAAPFKAGAQFNLSFTPMLVGLSAAPGATQTFEIAARNEGYRSAADLTVYTADVVQEPSGEYALAEAGTTPYSCAKWIQLSANKVRLEPNAALAVSGKVTVPRGVTGGRYAAVVFEQAPMAPEPDGSMGLTQFTQRFLVIIELTIAAPSAKKTLSITGFVAAPATAVSQFAAVYGADALVLAAQVKNEGNIHVLAQASMILRDSAGKRLTQMQLGAGRGLILPDASVNLVSVLTEGLPSGDYQADVSINYGAVRPVAAKVAFAVAGDSSEATSLSQATAVGAFVVEPTEVDIAYPAGATVARSFTVENRSDQTIRVEARAVPLVFDDAGELVMDFGGPAPANSCAGWIEFRPAAVEIRPGARQIQRMTISIPKGQSGGRYANLLFTATPVEGGEPWSGEAGALLFLRVGDDVAAAGALSPVTIEDGGPSVGTVFGTVFENTGSIHVAPRATVSLKRRVMADYSALGADVQYIGQGSLVDLHTITLEEENVVLPGARRDIYVAFTGTLEPGDYVIEFVVNYGGKAPAFVVREFTVGPSVNPAP